MTAHLLSLRAGGEDILFEFFESYTQFAHVSLLLAEVEPRIAVPGEADGRGGAGPDHRLRLWVRMGFDTYHEPPDELPAETRSFARMCASLTEEAEAIGWYEQRLAVETDPDARAVMRDAQGEEFKHFAMDLEFLLRRTPSWRAIAEGVLFRSGGIVEHGEQAEAEALDGGAGDESAAADDSGSLGIGSLIGAAR
ncbi:MAG TPA: hypothetical protein VND98_09555 [Solirubrobacterales bacterium]|nr:hypothetical protein [Solirubrobacterales bacterium]